jgi:glycosyltransferase involved in cell wall biosynthesis
MTSLDEIRAFNVADAALFVSKPVRDAALELHRYDKPTAVLYHYCNDNFLKLYNPLSDNVRTGIVYEGGANPPVPDEHTPFKYRSLYPHMRKIVEMGNELHMYIGNMDGFEAYQDFGAFVYPPTVYDEMMQGMVHRKWGALVFNNENLTEAQTNLTTMNKAYEYIMAGCPVISMGAPEQARVLRKYGVVLELEKMADLGNVDQKWGHLYPELKANVDKAREILTMERNIYIVEKLYKRVLENTHS